MVMPEGDGLQLIREVKETQPGARILAISGGGKYMESGDCLRMAKGLGAHAAVMKPFTPDQFREAMGQVMAALEAPATPA